MDISNFTKYKKSIQMKLPICNFDAKVLVENARVIFPTKSLSIRLILAPCVVQKIKARISRKWTPRFPIDTNKSLKLSKMPETLTLR